MAKKIGSRTITVFRKAKVDRLSDVAATETSHDVSGCVILPRSSFEEGKGWVVVEGRQIIAPYGADVLADDEVELPGDPTRWQVDGAPGDYEDKKARGKATIFYLERQ